MKKIVLIITAIAAITTNANAQTKFGPEVGLNLSTMVSTTFPGTTMKTGARIGGTADIALGDHFALQPGLFYVMMGSKLSFFGVSETFSSNYLHIPILIVYKFGDPEGNRFFIYTGPTIGYCLGGKIKGDGGDKSIKVGSDSSSDIKALDFGLSSGIGYQLSSGLIIRVGSFFGFSNGSPTSGDKTTNVAYQISVGWLFGGSKY